MRSLQLQTDEHKRLLELEAARLDALGADVARERVDAEHKHVQNLDMSRCVYVTIIVVNDHFIKRLFISIICNFSYLCTFPL